MVWGKNLAVRLANLTHAWQLHFAVSHCCRSCMLECTDLTGIAEHVRHSSTDDVSAYTFMTTMLRAVITRLASLCSHVLTFS